MLVSLCAETIKPVLEGDKVDYMYDIVGRGEKGLYCDPGSELRLKNRKDTPAKMRGSVVTLSFIFPHSLVDKNKNI